MNLKLQDNEQLSVTAANGLAGVFVNGVSLSASLSFIDTGNKVFIDDRISGIVEQTDLSIVHLSSSEYVQLSAVGQLLSNALYIVEDSFTNNYGKQIKNVAEPTLSDDAATKRYVDDAVSSIHIPTDLSAFTNSSGYLVSNDISDYYKKSETSSSSEISNELKKYQLSGNYLSSNALNGYETYNATVFSLSNDGYLTEGSLTSTLGSISKSQIASISPPSASVNSIYQTLKQLLSILSGQGGQI